MVVLWLQCRIQALSGGAVAIGMSAPFRAVTDYRRTTELDRN